MLFENFNIIILTQNSSHGFYLIIKYSMPKDKYINDLFNSLNEYIKE